MSSAKIVHGPRAGTRTTHLGDRLVLISVSGNEPVLEARLGEALTAAERAVIELAARGLSNSEIARTRGRSARSVANQLATIYRKLGVSGRRELSAKLRSARDEHG
jgi:DNA-binding CsgD family transcriptional regulator